MEKIMIFGLALCLGMMMSISPKPVKPPPTPKPYNGPNDIETVTRYSPNVVNDNNGSKPVHVPVTAEFLHSTR